MIKGDVKGVVFDLDSTLIRSSIDFPRMKTRMIAILEANGIPRGLLSPTETTVVTLEKAERTWDEREIPESDRKPILAQIDVVMNQTEMEAVPRVKEVEGTSEAISELREKGYRLAILTRSHHEYAVEALRKTDMLEYFELILARGETPKPKPYREALDHTAKLMKLRLDEIIFVGDNPIDSACAENAKVRFIAVTTGRTSREQWTENGCKIILDSVTELVEIL
jgi:phosphoglycolate phosphatase